MPSNRSLKQSIQSLELKIDELTTQAQHESITPQSRKKLIRSIAGAAEALVRLNQEIDPIIRPNGLFDPSHPDTAGRIVALTLAAQQKHPLSAIPQFYGAGVYAIYYSGDFHGYRALTNTESPIYVGKADPVKEKASDPVGQGLALSNRLREHAKSIGKATSTLKLNDFQCRFLIVQSGFQASAESYLINFFKPIWNKETKVCFGIGKHGDSASTRGNMRSPWDTLHPGRSWAEKTTQDQKQPSDILGQIDAHLHEHPPLSSFHEIIDRIMDDVRQFLPKSKP